MAGPSPPQVTAGRCPTIAADSSVIFGHRTWARSDGNAVRAADNAARRSGRWLLTRTQHIAATVRYHSDPDARHAGIHPRWSQALQRPPERLPWSAASAAAQASGQAGSDVYRPAVTPTQGADQPPLLPTAPDRRPAQSPWDRASQRPDCARHSCVRCSPHTAPSFDSPAA